MMQNEVEIFSKAVDDYIKKLNSMPPEEARKESINSLIRTGVLDENGNEKEQIVTGEFFGWP